MSRESGLISVIICSAGRPEPLKATLESLEQVATPHGRKAELLLIDNNASPTYQGLLDENSLPWDKRYIHEPTRGLSNARNRGVAESKGEVIVFTDDDMWFEPDFLVALTRHLLDGTADAVAGAIKIARELEEPWMEPWHRIAFASTEHLDMDDPKGFVGANFGFHSRVLKDVPGFDVELGAGKLGTGEETVFASQLIKAGYRIVGVPESVVWHHFDPSRKSRESLMKASEAWGKSNAWIDYKYNGLRVKQLGLRLLKAQMQLRAHRMTVKRGASPMDVKESTLVKNIAYCREMQVLQGEQ
jgi:glucosyl-dolichyl phosphate glucuronosyltransferase